MMKRGVTWLLIAWFSVALTGCETIKGLGRDILNLGDVLTGKKPGHRTLKSEDPKEAKQVIHEKNRVLVRSEKTR